MTSDDSSRPRTALALQGGGAHGAFGWGVLDALLEGGFAPDPVCGVSSGALLAVMLAQGWARGGAPGARAALRLLWERVGQAHALSPLRNTPLERWLWGWDISNSLAWQGLETAIRLFGPAQLNPLGHNPLRSIVADLLDRDALAAPSAPRVSIAATDVETGQAVLWHNEEITVDAVLASCCLPFAFPAVEIGGRAFWDGGYAGNPPIAPLLTPAPPDLLVLVRAQPARRRGVPRTPTEIMNRMSELASHGVLEAELAALPPSVALQVYDGDDTLGELSISSRFNAEPDFLAMLFRAGRARVEREWGTAAAAD